MSTVRNRGQQQPAAKRSPRLPSGRPHPAVSTHVSPGSLLRKPAGRAVTLSPGASQSAPASDGSVHAPQPLLDLHRERTITVKEAAYRVGKSPDAIYNWLRTGRLRGCQPGGRGCSILVIESSLEEALGFRFERQDSHFPALPSAAGL